MVAVLGFFAIGCTPMEWRRGEEVATLETEDFMRCRNYASREATRHLPVTGLYPVPYVGRDARGNPIMLSRGVQPTDRLLLEHNFMNKCMNKLGYQLVPIPRETGPTPADISTGD